MHITQSTLAMTSAHHQESATSRQWAAGYDDGSGGFQALMIANLPGQAATETGDPAKQAQEDPALALDKVLQSLIHALFGSSGSNDASAETADLAKQIRDKNAGTRPLAQLTLVHTREEESCSFSASGNICLADGSTRQFDVGYELERSEENTLLSFGAPLRDPLVIDFDAPTGALGKQRVDFDLNGDGQTESMRMPDETSGLLFMDRNGNGVADDGSELFGPTTGNGFNELSKLDSDGNHWIDEADAAYGDLKLWRIDAEGNQQVQTLAEAGIGALATDYQNTPFTIKEHGEVVGQMRGSSVWLGETTGAGIVRQIDIATETPTA
jgi:hypothetical protein